MASPAFGSDESRKSASLPASTPTSRASLAQTAFNSNVSVSVSLINKFHDRAEPRQVAGIEIESRAPNLIARHLFRQTEFVQQAEQEQKPAETCKGSTANDGQRSFIIGGVVVEKFFSLARTARAHALRCARV